MITIFKQNPNEVGDFLAIEFDMTDISIYSDLQTGQTVANNVYIYVTPEKKEDITIYLKQMYEVLENSNYTN